MKYKWTPFQLLAFVALCVGIYELIIISRMKSDPGLGGLAPYIYLGFAFGIFIVDILVQQILSKRSFYISEAILVLAFIIWIISLGGI